MTSATIAANSLSLRFTGSVSALDETSRDVLFGRSLTPNVEVQSKTAEILAAVRRDGDAALRRMAVDYDGVTLSALEVDQDRCREALRALDPALRRALNRARDNIRTAHSAFRPTSSHVETEPGIIVGRRADPFALAGVYAPGGRATYPSSLLMGAVTARVAGVARVIVCSPPGKDGLPDRSVLAAAALAEVDAVFAVGGAGAVAAMAFGTSTVPAVDIIVGPGNAYVAEAKRQVASTVATDAPAGPSELLIIADATASPEVMAREILAQAEHDPDAAVITLCIGEDTVSRVSAALGGLLPAQERATIIGQSLAANGGILLAADYDQALAFAARYAPEHLMIAVDVAMQTSLLARVRNAGTVFVGQTSSVAFGDYMTGANHVLPTAGGARLRSGLSTSDFVRWTTWQQVEPQAAASLAEDVGVFADAEGLSAHSAAARQWQTP